jgi:foldase protein PrsA
MTAASLKLIASAVAASLAIAGCGGDDGLPDDAVAKVGDTLIGKDEYEKWYRLVTLSPFLKGEQRDVFKRETMQTLIETEWTEQEADARGITVSDDEVDRTYEERKRAFPNEQAFRRFVEQAGLTEDDFRDRIRVELLQRKLEERIVGDERDVSAGEIEAYYRRNRQRFSRPETRDFIFALTRTEVAAKQARQALESGKGWQAVLRRYSIDPENSTAHAVRGPKLAEGREALERAVYRTGEGEISGPVRTRFGWYVFEVTKVTPPSRETLEDATQEIASLLRSRRRAGALKRYRSGYRDKTVCADDFKVPECSNGPEEKA